MGQRKTRAAGDGSDAGAATIADLGHGDVCAGHRRQAHSASEEPASPADYTPNYGRLGQRHSLGQRAAAGTQRTATRRPSRQQPRPATPPCDMAGQHATVHLDMPDVRAGAVRSTPEL